MVKEIVQIGSPILTQKTRVVTDLNSDEVKNLITDLLDTCKANGENTAGLSAPQIDSDLRVCVCRRIDLEDKADPEKELAANWEVMVNPEITFKSSKQSLYWEGCLSIGKGDQIVYGPVTRPDEVTVKYLSPTAETKAIKGTGFFSHVLQHEIDHLEGILYLTYVDSPQNLWKGWQLDQYSQEHNGEFPPVR